MEASCYQVLKKNLATTHGVSFLVLNVGYLISLCKGRFDLLNIIWYPGFFFISAALYLTTSHPTRRNLLLVGLTFLYAVLRSTFLAYRSLKLNNQSNVDKYREQQPYYSSRGSEYIRTVLGHTLVMSAVASPIFIIESFDQVSEFTVIDLLGTVVFFIGLCLESTADCQLLHFQKDPANKTKVMKTKLWYWCRFPNYFGALLVLWGLSIISLSVKHGWIALSSPLILGRLYTFIVIPR